MEEIVTLGEGRQKKNNYHCFISNHGVKPVTCRKKDIAPPTPLITFPTSVETGGADFSNKPLTYEIPGTYCILEITRVVIVPGDLLEACHCVWLHLPDEEALTTGLMDHGREHLPFVIPQQVALLPEAPLG